MVLALWKVTKVSVRASVCKERKELRKKDRKESGKQGYNRR